MVHGGFVSHSSTKSSGLLWVKEILIPDTHICEGLDPRNQDWTGHIRNVSKCSDPLLEKWLLEAGICLFQDKATNEAIPYSQSLIILFIHLVSLSSSCSWHTHTHTMWTETHSRTHTSSGVSTELFKLSFSSQVSKDTLRVWEPWYIWK